MLEIGAERRRRGSVDCVNTALDVKAATSFGRRRGALAKRRAVEVRQRAGGAERLPRAPKGRHESNGDDQRSAPRLEPGGA